jgi:glycolate oxidase FAD binding subunit
MVIVSATPTPDLASGPAQADVAEQVRAAYESSRAVYPRGGRTALDFGNAPTQPGDELDLTGLNRIVDYTPRDMTILIEAGVRMADLAGTLAAEGQHLPIDVPRAAEATIGGVVATNWNGPRRYGHGTIRDYVIGIHAVDGRGVPFKGGGRVVKNVAGYDFCKLLTGSLGTLGVITQLALKVRPKSECSGAVVAACADVATARILLERLAMLPAQPVAIDYVLGAGWKVPTIMSNRQAEINSATPHIVVRFEGSEPECDWFGDQIQTELQQAGGMSVALLTIEGSATLWQQQVEFADRGTGDSPDDSPLVIKVAVPSSSVADVIEHLLKHDPECAIQCHAGSGIVIARFKNFTHSHLTSVLVGKLRPAAIRLGGSVVVVSSKLDGLTPHLIWGGRTDATVLLENVKRKFDPRSILNPGRFAYD